MRLETRRNPSETQRSIHRQPVAVSVGFHSCFGNFKFLDLKIICSARFLVSPRSTQPTFSLFYLLKPKGDGIIFFSNTDTCVYASGDDMTQQISVRINWTPRPHPQFLLDILNFLCYYFNKSYSLHASEKHLRKNIFRLLLRMSPASPHRKKSRHNDRSQRTHKILRHDGCC